MSELCLTGIVSRIIFKNEENGYSVFVFLTNDTDIIATGNILEIAPGESLSIYGDFKTHKSYGEQFAITYYERELPKNIVDIISYLGSGIIKGIGPKLAEKIVNKFGEETFDIIGFDYKRLTIISGITEKKAKDISNSFNKLTILKNLSVFLNKYSINIDIIPSIYKIYGDNSLDIIINNPYILIEFDIDFGICDGIASNLGIDLYKDERIKAGILYTMKFNLQSGHSFLPKDKLIIAVISLLNVEQEGVELVLDALIKKGYVIDEFICNTNAIYLKEIYECETFICETLINYQNQSYSYDFDISLLIDEIQKNINITFTDMQKSAIIDSALSGITVLTGGPGTGKTTTLNGMIGLFEMLGLSVSLAAPTGRAAKRMTDLCCVPAKTIHRLLEAMKTPNNETIFGKNENNKLDTDIIILDEVSMLDINLMAAVLKALHPDTRIILVGDYDQLPPVGPGNLLRDIIKSEKFNVISLNRIFRQASESLIITNAHHINKGEPIISGDNKSDFFLMKKPDSKTITKTIVSLCSERLPAFYNLHPHQIQVLTPSRNSKLGTKNLNTFLQEALNPLNGDKCEQYCNDKIFRVGDKVMQMNNNYDILFEDDDTKLGVFNGDIGFITSIDKYNQIIKINFDNKIALYTFENLKELDLAYALTVHKSQGSEFEAVILALSNNTPKKLLTRNILYTAITRAKKLLIIVSSDNTVEYMINNNTKHKRYSALRARLVRI